MADNKYGRIFTENDVLAIISRVANTKETRGIDPEQLLREVLECDGPFDDYDELRLKFDADEPLFILRGRDKRAAGAIMHYRDHQSPSAPHNHTAAIDAAFLAFNTYRQEHPGMMKEPD